MSAFIATTCAALQQAFLAGETVHPVSFAEKLGVSRQSVHNALSRFGPLVAQRYTGTRGAPGAKMTEWVCVNLEGMREFVPPPGFLRTALISQQATNTAMLETTLNAWIKGK